MVAKQDVYEVLEGKMLKYADIVGMPVKGVAESLVMIQAGSNIKTMQIDKNMLKYTGESIYVRRQVLTKLSQASQLLAKIDPGLCLRVVYGYRALSIQQELFKKYKKRLEKIFTGPELLEAVHRLIAVPEVSGHPTGGAVDVQILKLGKPISMGTKIWQFTKNSYSFSPFISQPAKANRQLLRRVMLKVGFAPFDGEWWHFSYGDKEWAKYYNKPFALYEQIEF